MYVCACACMLGVVGGGGGGALLQRHTAQRTAAAQQVATNTYYQYHIAENSSCAASSHKHVLPVPHRRGREGVTGSEGRERGAHQFGAKTRRFRGLQQSRRVGGQEPHGALPGKSQLGFQVSWLDTGE